MDAADRRDRASSSTATKRAALWARLQALYAEELPSLPLYFRSEPHILPQWLEGVAPTGHMDASTLWVEHWRAKAS